MEDLSLHILDIAENSIRAGAEHVSVKLNITDDVLHLTIEDDGEGMDSGSLEKVSSPFYSSKEGKEFGLGISLLKYAVLETGGSFEIDSTAGRGTIIRASFIRNHPDMKPLGDVSLTMKMLRLSHPGIEFRYDFTGNSA